MPDSALADEDYCYVTTIGRRSGRPREIEIWFGLDGDTVYMLSGGRDHLTHRLRAMLGSTRLVALGRADVEGGAHSLAPPKRSDEVTETEGTA